MSEFEKKCKEFYVTLSKNYPDSKIFAITPIWRKDYLNEKGAFENDDSVLEFGFKEGNYEDYFIKSGFSKEQIDNYMVMNDVVKPSKSRN